MRLEPHSRPAAPFEPTELYAAAYAVDGDARRALILAGSLASVPRPGEGRTAFLFDTLSTLAAADLTAARVAGQRVADLQLYVRQHHAERDDAALGRMLVTKGSTPW